MMSGLALFLLVMLMVGFVYIKVDVSLLKGYECEIVGRVCMDQMMIRLPKQFPMGTTVTLIGDGMPVERVAKEIGTISYEIPMSN